MNPVNFDVVPRREKEQIQVMLKEVSLLGPEFS